MDRAVANDCHCPPPRGRKAARRASDPPQGAVCGTLRAIALLVVVLVVVQLLVAPVFVEHELREASVLNDAIRQPGRQFMDPFDEIHFRRALRQLR